MLAKRHALALGGGGDRKRGVRAAQVGGTDLARLDVVDHLPQPAALLRRHLHVDGVAVGGVLGRWSYRLLTSRRRLTLDNLAGAFPDADKAERDTIGRRCFEHYGGAFLEALSVGRLAAEAGVAIVSGGARGVDQASMRGSLQAGGNAVGVLADSLERAALARDSREPLIEGRLVLVSPYDPAARFNVGHAMQRNKLIYALSDAALVVNSDVGKGGTWTGAVEQLNKLRLVPVFVRSTGRTAPGLDALLEQGARPWPNPDRGDDLASVFSAEVEPVAPTSVQGEFSFREGGANDGSDEVRDAPLANNAADERRKK